MAELKVWFAVLVAATNAAEPITEQLYTCITVDSLIWNTWGCDGLNKQGYARMHAWLKRFEAVRVRVGAADAWALWFRVHISC